MSVQLLMLAFSAEAWLANAYWACLVFGGGLVLISVLGSHGDADVDAGGFDHDVDISADADFDADGLHVEHAHAAWTGLSTWLSVRFVVYFVAGFGAMGVSLTYLTNAPTFVIAAVALVFGIVIGQAAHQLMRYVKSSGGNSATRSGDYVRKLARVTVPIAVAGTGEVALHVRGTERFIPAISTEESREFAVGDQAVVVAYRSGVAEVVSRAQFEKTQQPQGESLC